MQVSPPKGASTSSRAGRGGLNDALPPLLRGIGTTLVLTATVVAFVIARHGADVKMSASPPLAASNLPRDAQAELNSLTAEVRELRHEVEHENVVEEVLENRWFEWLGFTGTAIIASSFYSEFLIRRKK